jgi:tetratricopeptide (TPR) repeat protein
MLALRLACALGFAALFSSGTARAAEPNAEARRLYAEGKAEYAQGHYTEAIGLFERSYALSESAALLFNMAQAHRLAGPAHCSDAVSLYKSYLLAEPNVENQKEVEERIAELGDCSAQKAPETPASEAPAAQRSVPAQVGPRREPPPEPRRPALPTGPVLVTGSGAALLVAGGVLYARAWSKHREAERRCPCYPGSYASWEVLTNVSYALLAVGGATLAGGVTWWVVGEPSKNGQPSRAMLGFAGRF